MCLLTSVEDTVNMIWTNEINKIFPCQVYLMYFVGIIIKIIFILFSIKLQIWMIYGSGLYNNEQQYTHLALKSESLLEWLQIKIKMTRWVELDYNKV